MKIIFLFLVYKNLEFVRHTCSKLSGNDVFFYIHADLKSKENWETLCEINNLSLLKDRFDSKWGGAELIYATVSGLTEICKQHSDGYIILMSESDYPVKSLGYIKEYLNTSNKDFVKISPLPCLNPLGTPCSFWLEGGMRRINCYALRLTSKQIATIEPRKMNWGNCRQFGKVLLYKPSMIPKAIRFFFKQKRTIPDGLKRYCGGDQWFAIRLSTGSKILEYLQHSPQLLDDAKYIECVDEIFFPTVVDHLIPKNEVVFSTLRFVNWPENSHSNSPAYLTMKDQLKIDSQIENKDILFVRKIEDGDVVNYIDKRVCKEESL